MGFGRFFLGGSAYVGLELLWRGRSHWSMFLAGGTCFLLLGKLRALRIPALPKAGLGAGVITVVEFFTGLLVNRRYRVWDYRKIPGNLLGQVCPLFTILWIPVAGAAMGLHGLLDRLDRSLARRHG